MTSDASTASNTGPVNVTAPPVPDSAVVLIVKAFCCRAIVGAVTATEPPLVVIFASTPMYPVEAPPVN